VPIADSVVTVRNDGSQSSDGLIVSSIIWLGLVVMWAVVLIPMWLRRHDETEETRSVDRFTSAMHTLSRREAGAGRRYVVMPQRARGVDVHVSGASAGARPGILHAVSRWHSGRQERRRTLTAADRRRRTLLALLTAAMVTLLAAVLIGGMVLWTLQVIVDLCLVALVVGLVLRARRVDRARLAAVARSAQARKRAQEDRRAANRRSADMPIARPAVATAAPAMAPAASVTSLAYAAAPEAFEPVAEPAAEREFEPVFDQTAFASADVVAEDDGLSALDAVFAENAGMLHAESEAVPAETTDAQSADELAAEDDDTWDPVPVPPPTYTTKPAAPPRRARPPIFDPLLPASEGEIEFEPTGDLEEILDRRWAVND
jgi:hypothetical protein